ncbi:MAG: BamA/TamA family outer membrane protein [Spirosomataceae bacterium]
MFKIKKTLFFSIFFLQISLGFAQKKRWSILPFPVVYYTPETKWAYGAALTSTFRFQSDSANARPSQVSLGIVFTQEKQALYYLPFQVFLKNAQYYLNGEIGFYRYNFYYFGIGTKPVAKELYGVDFPRIKINAFKKVKPHLYLGLRYQYEDYRITDTETLGAFASNQVPGSPRSITSGVGLGAFYDTRDVIFFPSKGMVADLGYFYNASVLGGNVRFDRLYADVSGYKAIVPHTVLVGNLYSNFTWGNTPFNMLSELGGGQTNEGVLSGSLS